MRTKIDISKKFNLDKVSFDLSSEINESAKAVVEDHEKRLSFGQGVDGRPMAKLKPLTIQGKRKQGYAKPRVPLYATGTLKDVKITKKASKTNQEARIMPDETRREIGAFHQEGGGKLPKREWFGVTEKVEERLLKRMGRQIERH